MPKSRALKSLLLACIFVCASVSLPHAAGAAEQRVALVIGNSAYPTARLRNPVNDATAMAAKLRTLGFDVVLRTDATQREMSRAISEFGKKVTLGSVSLFYFAGHGVQVRGKNFLIPVDADIETEGAVRGETVDVEHVLDQLGPAQLSMVILDACRNNPFETRFRRIGGGLAQIDAPTGTLLAYATAPGKVAADGSGSNGLYTAALLKALDMPGLKVEDVFKQVRNEVLKASDNRQIPWESSSLTSEFYFRSGTKAEIENAQLRQSEKERLELLKETERLRKELLKLVASQATVQAGFSPAGTSGAAAGVASSDPQPQQQIATAPATPASAPAAAPPSPAEWAARLALLEKLHGQLTFSKAIAILLDISNAEELSLLLKHEGEINKMNWQTAYAMGRDDTGRLVWGGGYRLKAQAWAFDTALDFCARAPGDSCKVVMVNQEFLEKAFLEMAKLLGGQNVTAVRQAYLQSLKKRPTEVAVGMGGNAGTNSPNAMSYGFSSIRE